MRKEARSRAARSARDPFGDDNSARNGASPSSLERVVGFAVVGEVAEVVHGVFEEGGCGEDRQADGGAGEGAGDGEGEASGFAKEG